MILKVKKLYKDSVMPMVATEGSAGIDLYVNNWTCAGNAKGLEGGLFAKVWVGTGVAVEIPEGYVGLLFLRSSLSSYGSLANGVGVIDSDYRGEIKFSINVPNFDRDEDGIPKAAARFEQPGTRIGQLVIVPCVMGKNLHLKEADELSETARGEGGFGSTGV